MWSGVFVSPQQPWCKVWGELHVGLRVGTRYRHSGDRFQPNSQWLFVFSGPGSPGFCRCHEPRCPEVGCLPELVL
jgi:hypothetical protein